MQSLAISKAFSFMSEFRMLLATTKTPILHLVSYPQWMKLVLSVQQPDPIDGYHKSVEWWGRSVPTKKWPSPRIFWEPNAKSKPYRALHLTCLEVIQSKSNMLIFTFDLAHNLRLYLNWVKQRGEELSHVLLLSHLMSCEWPMNETDSQSRATIIRGFSVETDCRRSDA